MSTQGMHMGGIRTLDDIKARCEEVGNCWEWQRGYQNHGKTPAAVYVKRHMNARRLAWMLANGGQDAPDGQVVVSTCGNHRCVNPAHLQAKPKPQAMQELATRPISTTRRAKIVAAKRARSHITPEMRHAALTMDGPAHRVGAALGMAKSTVSKIRRSVPAAGNPFAGLMRGLA